MLQAQDSGVYECQVSSTPVTSHTVILRVAGNLANTLTVMGNISVKCFSINTGVYNTKYIVIGRVAVRDLEDKEEDDELLSLCYPIE